MKLFLQKRSETLPTGQHTFITLLLLVITVLCVLALRALGLASGDAFALTLNITGGLGGAVVSFILPSAIYLKLKPHGVDCWSYREAQFVNTMGYAIMIIVVVMNIYSFSK